MRYVAEGIIILFIVAIVGGIITNKYDKLATEMIQLKYDLAFEQFKVEQLQLTISGQEATIASYKENLTECLKDNKLSGQDEFTGE